MSDATVEAGSQLNRPWFDPETGTLLLEQYVPELDSFKKAMADEEVTESELTEHVQHVIGLMRQLERMLSPEANAVATEMLCELAVLQVLQARRTTFM